MALKSFTIKKPKSKIFRELDLIIKDNSQIIKSMSQNYKDKYSLKKIKKIFDKNDIRLIGMGGSVLGAQAIYYFLNDKIKKKFHFIDNLISQKKNVNSPPK